MEDAIEMTDSGSVDIVLRNHGSNELGGLGPDSVHMDMEDDFRHAPGRLLRWLWKM